MELRVLRGGERAAAECVLWEVREEEAGVESLRRYLSQFERPYAIERPLLFRKRTGI
jgi:hypothetical protein